MLQLKLSKSFKDISIDIEFSTRARIVGIKGVSGVGKTTLLSMIAGLVKPDAGHIKFNDSVFFDSYLGTNIPAYKRRIGYVFQDTRLFPHLNVKENLNYGRQIQKLKSTSYETDYIMEMLDITRLINRPIHNLSGGEKQRVAIGRAFLSCPALLLLDEPMASLDEKRKSDIIPCLMRLKAETNIPIIYVSHEMKELTQLADEIIELKTAF